MNNKLLIGIIGVILAALLFGGTQDSPLLGAGGDYRTAPTFYSASTTNYTISQTSTRILATSTPTKRLAASIGNINCTSAGVLSLRMDSDVAATANTGYVILASTTAHLTDYPNSPVVQGSVQAIVNGGTCTVPVTEWRSQY